MTRKFIPFIAAGAALAAPAAADPGSLSFTTGVDYSVGDYGAPQDTKILVVPFSLRYRVDRLRLSATAPYLKIRGPGVVVGGGEGGPIVVDPNAPQPITTRSGLGDVSLGATYTFLEQDSAGFDLDLGARVKLPTGSRAKGLSTGEADFGVNAEISRSFGTITPFASVGYRMPGDPEGVELRNSVTASIGSSFSLGKPTLIASYDYAGKSSVNADTSQSLFAGLAVPASDRFTVTGYGTKGFSDGAADYSAGLLLTTKLF